MKSCDCDVNSYELRHSHSCSSRSNEPIEFKTEIERLKALAVLEACIDAERIPTRNSSDNEGLVNTFNRLFPPIAPPKMVPFEAWVMTDECGQLPNIPALWDEPHPRYAVAPYNYPHRVRVVEVEDEPTSKEPRLVCARCGTERTVRTYWHQAECLSEWKEVSDAK